MSFLLYILVQCIIKCKLFESFQCLYHSTYEFYNLYRYIYPFRYYYLIWSEVNYFLYDLTFKCIQLFFQNALDISYFFLIFPSLFETHHRRLPRNLISHSWPKRLKKEISKSSHLSNNKYEILFASFYNEF